MALNDIMFNLNRWHEEKIAGVKAIGLNIAAKAEKEAKIKAPWQPVGKPKRPSKFTGHARQSLQGNAFWESKTSFKITLGSDIEYMVYLELAMDRKIGRASCRERVCIQV